jgi:hypothetical protein
MLRPGTHSTSHSNTHSNTHRRRNSARFLSPGLPDNPTVMSRDDSIEPLYSQGCDQGL